MGSYLKMGNQTKTDMNVIGDWYSAYDMQHIHVREYRIEFVCNWNARVATSPMKYLYTGSPTKYISNLFYRQFFAPTFRPTSFSVYHFFSCLRDRWFEHWGNWGILSRVGCFETGWLEALPCFKVVAPNSFSSFEIFLPSHKVNSSLFLQKWEKSFPFMLAKLVFKWVTPAGSSTVWSMESLQMVP